MTDAAADEALAFTTWHYEACLTRHKDGDAYDIREVYTGPNGALSWTADACGPTGDTWEEVCEDAQRMLTASRASRALDITDEANPVKMYRPQVPPVLKLDPYRLPAASSSSERP